MCSMRSLRANLGALALFTGWAVLVHGGGDPADAKKEKASDDVTAAVKEMNSDKFASPPTDFRPGKVTSRQLDAKAVEKTDTGFRIQLPSKAPIPTPTIYNGKLYASGGFHSREFYCFDALTGKLVWAVDLDDDGPSSCVVENDVCVFNTESCTIFALDAASGKLLWSYFLGDPLTSTPTIAGGKVFTSYPVAGGGGQVNPNGKPTPKTSHALACFDLKTGKILWQRWIDSDVMSAPVAVDGELYCTSFAGTVYKFNQADGGVISAICSRATSAPIIVGKNVFMTQRADNGKNEKASEKVAGVGRDDAKLKFEGEKKAAEYLDAEVQGASKLGEVAKKLDAGNGFAAGAPAAANPDAAKGNVGQYNVSSMQSFQGSRILHFKDANFNCMGDEIICTDPVNGKTRWNVKLTGDLKKEGGHLAAPPAAAGGQLFLATLVGNVLQIDPEKGTITRTYKFGVPLRSQPAIVDGRIYVGSQNGQIVCLDTGDSSFTGWTTWGANSGHTNVAGDSRK